MDLAWRVDDDNHTDPTDTGSTRASGLLSVDQIRSAIRRRWRTPVLAAILGGLLGLAFAVLVPPTSHATVTLLLAHADGADPETAMATDVSLLETTTVAEQVISELHLGLTPTAFKKSFVATPTTSQVLSIETSGPSDRDAVARAKTLGDAFLAFRAQQLSDQSDAVAAGYQDQVKSLQKQSDKLSQQYDRLTAAGSRQQDRAAEVLDQRAKIDGQINTLQASAQDASLQAASVTRASHVVDPAAVVPTSSLKRAVLTTFSGVVGGLAIGALVVLVGALTTRKVRTRRDVATALGTPVRSTTGSLHRRRPRRRLLPARLRRRTAARDGAVGEVAVDVLAAGLGTAASPSRRATNRIALAAVDEVDSAARVISRLAVDRTDRGDQVFLVDLTADGLLADAVDHALRRTSDDDLEVRATPVVYRPAHAPELARGPVGEDDELAGDLLPTSPYRRSFDRADLVLTLVEAGPAAELGLLHTWADRQVALVTAGRSTEERLRTTGEMLHASGVELRFAMLAGVDGTDESLGLFGDDTDPTEPATPVRHRADRRRS